MSCLQVRYLLCLPTSNTQALFYLAPAQPRRKAKLRHCRCVWFCCVNSRHLHTTDNGPARVHSGNLRTLASLGTAQTIQSDYGEAVKRFISLHIHVVWHHVHCADSTCCLRVPGSQKNAPFFCIHRLSVTLVLVLEASKLPSIFSSTSPSKMLIVLV